MLTFPYTQYVSLVSASRECWNNQTCIVTSTPYVKFPKLHLPSPVYVIIPNPGKSAQPLPPPVSKGKSPTFPSTPTNSIHTHTHTTHVHQDQYQLSSPFSLKNQTIVVILFLDCASQTKINIHYFSYCRFPADWSIGKSLLLLKWIIHIHFYILVFYFVFFSSSFRILT